MFRFSIQPLFHRHPADAPRLPWLPYRCEPTGYEQARFRGRWKIVPEIDLGRFRTRAEIDWVELHVSLAFSQGDTWANVQKLLTGILGRRPYVTIPIGKRHKSGSVFEIRVQRPQPEMLMQAIDALRARYGFRGEVWIKGIEIAIDWWPVRARERSEDEMEVERLHLVSVLQRHFLARTEFMKDDRDKPRFTHDGKDGHETEKLLGPVRARHKEEKQFVDTWLKPLPETWRDMDLDMHNPPVLDGTMYVGAQEADVMVRIQNKTTDQRKGKKAKKLEPAERRARVEVRLQGDMLEEMELDTIEDLARGRFAKLRCRFFEFWIPTVSTRLNRHRVDINYFKATGVYGLEVRENAMETLWKRHNRSASKRKAGAYRGRRKASGRKRSTGTRLAFAELNRRADDALEALDTQWREFKA